MIIDAHLTLPPKEAGTVEGLLETMHANDIDKAVLVTVEGFSSHTTREFNDRVAAEAALFPDALIPWAAVNPHEGLGEGAAMELRRAVTELGMSGLKLQPFMHRFAHSYHQVDVLMEEVVRLGIPVLVHTGTAPWATPLQFAHLARRYPTATVILAHAGGKELWSDALLAARQLDNLWLETSATPLNGLQKMVDTLGPERIVFGSNTFVSATITYRLGVVKALQISDQARKAILGGNMARLLGLSESTSRYKSG